MWQIKAVMLLVILSLGSSAFSSPRITAISAILIDAQTGKVLYSKNKDEKMHPASTTKVMTAILLLEKGNLQDKVKISKSASERKVNESSIWLKEGEEVKVEDLLYAILLRSANDASVAVAEYISGSEEKFVALMNKKAKEVGAKNTNFVNSYGMTDENHYSTSYDLAQIARYAVKNERFCEIVKTGRKQIPWEGNPWNRLLINRNKLIKKYPYGDGIKTGFTREAGYCLVASATKDNWKLIAVVLKSENMYEDAIELFEYGYKNFKPQVFMNKNYTVKIKKIFTGKPRELKIITQEKAMIILSKKERPINDVRGYLQLNKIKLPVKKSEMVGKIIFRDENKKEVASSPVVAYNDVNKNWFLIIVIYFLIAIIGKIMYNRVILHYAKKRKR